MSDPFINNLAKGSKFSHHFSTWEFSDTPRRSVDAFLIVSKQGTLFLEIFAAYLIIINVVPLFLFKL